MANLGSSSVTLTPAPPDEEPLKARSVHQGNFLHDGYAVELHALEVLGGKAGAQSLQIPGDGDDLQNGARGEHELEVPILHDDRAEHELLQAGEGGTAQELGRVREHPRDEVEAAEGGADEQRGGEVQAGHGPGAIDEDEILDTLGGKEREPARKHSAVGDEQKRARVRGERDGDGISHGPRETVGAEGEEVPVDEDERRRAPEAAGVWRAQRCARRPWRGGGRGRDGGGRRGGR